MREVIKTVIISKLFPQICFKQCLCFLYNLSWIMLLLSYVKHSQELLLIKNTYNSTWKMCLIILLSILIWILLLLPSWSHEPLCKILRAEKQTTSWRTIWQTVWISHGEAHHLGKSNNNRRYICRRLLGKRKDSHTAGIHILLGGNFLLSRDASQRTH